MCNHLNHTAAECWTDNAGIDPKPFAPDYTPGGARILRGRIRLGEGGTATITFRGQVADATKDVWVEAGRSGRLSLYALVAPDDTTATEVKVALVPTGKRAPLAHDGSPALRLGGVNGTHAFLLSLDGSADRAAYETEQDRRRMAREAARMLTEIDPTDAYAADPDPTD